MRTVMIDPHVHLRDWVQDHKETLAHAFSLASRLGIGALFEMPNTDPTLTTRETVNRRIADADRARQTIPDAPFHGLYVGLTGQPEQIRAAAGLHGELFPRVVGCKLYAGHSTGRMGVITQAAQYTVWRTLARAGYRGVVAVHAEREDLLRPELKEDGDPLTHSAGRPPLAEIASVQTQIALAEAAGFRGVLHICHVSTPEALEIIIRERTGLPFLLTAGVTPHHLLLDTESAAAASAASAVHPTTGRDAPVGTGFTVNPPLRNRPDRLRLWEAVLAGGADWIESDHAPHTWEEKLAGAAGLPGIPAFRFLADTLARDIPSERVRSMTGKRVLDVFRIDPDLVPAISPAIIETTEDGFPGADEYSWDPYRGFRTGRTS